MNPPVRQALWSALLASIALLSACGGGGGGGGGGTPVPPPRFGLSTQFEGGTAGCALDTQKKFVRAYLDEVYLWYAEIPEVDAATYATIPDYFDALLVRTPDANGVTKDRYSTVLPAPQPQPQSAQQNSFGAYVPVEFDATSAGGRHFGYIQFDDHDIGAQDQLIGAFSDLKNKGVQDLVLDLRQNSGGYLYIAQAAASMVTGPGNAGRLFERLRYNDKRSTDTAQSAMNFLASVQYPEVQYAQGTPLPQLGLPRVFVLTSGRTCSASESIINGLRGIDVQVIRIGTATCGKPYGFRQKNNCGYAYFAIEFQGMNAKGYGDYTTGFPAVCNVPDDGSAPGGPTDPLLAAARYYMDNDACPTGTATGAQSAAMRIIRDETPSRPWTGRLLLPQQR